MPDGGRKNDTSAHAKLKVSRTVRTFSTSSFFDVSFVSKVAKEAKSAAEDVERMSAQADTAAIDLAKQSVGQYSTTVSRASASISRPFFDAADPRTPTSQRKDDVKLFPFIDHVQVSFSRDGVIDGFYTRVVMSVMKHELERTRAVRVFRCDHGPSELSSPLTMTGIGKVAVPTGRKNIDKLVTYERSHREDGTLGALSKIQPDGFVNLRNSNPTVENRFAITQGDVQRRISAKNLAGILTPQESARVDPGVAFDLKTISRVRSMSGQARSHAEAVGRLFVPKETAERASLPVQKTKGQAGKFAIEKRNALAFREVHFATISNLTKKTVGDVVEFSFVDNSVMRGRRYSYYVVIVDNEMRESRRSEVVTLTVDRFIPPATPEIAISNDGRRVYLQMISNDSFVEKFEVYRRERNVTANRPVELLAIGDGVDVEERSPTRAGWAQIGEAIVSQDMRSSFSDGRVVPGSEYEYRIYAVDCFGNKSPTPADGVTRVRSGHNPMSLEPLTTTAEVDQRTRKANVSVYIDDPRVRAVFISRRDLTIREHSFRDPLTGDIPAVNTKDVKRYRTSDPVLHDQRAGWNGHVQINGTGSAGFVDNTVRFDHSYQYCAYGVDARGIRTPYAFSQVIFVARKPLVNAPVELSSTVTTSSVMLSWKDANISFSPDDLMGNRETLENTSVRALYQVQRKDIGGVNWESFPLTDQPVFDDELLDADPPSYRPAYPSKGRTYLYRVGTLQSGNYYSNFTEPVAVKVVVPPEMPSFLAVRCSDTRIRPTYTVVNWNSGGDVAYWQVDRVAVNNYVSPSISSPDQISALNFVEVARVTPEASRATARNQDETRKRDESLFIGERFYIDSDIEIGNSYFYRVRAVSTHGDVSEYVYRGIYISNSTFERKLKSVVTSEERERLSKTLMPMTFIPERFR